MLLYTRLAPPKAPKRRSRGGCSFCKDKKKKCDEERPKCSRCQEHDQECVYEPVKPRQRRRNESGDEALLELLPSGEATSHSQTVEERRHSPPDIRSTPKGLTHRSHPEINKLSTTITNIIPDDSVEEIVHRDSSTSTQSSRSPSLALIAPVLTASPHLEFSSPAFAEFTQLPNRRVLVDHFANVLSHLIVLREDGGNPFQRLVLPLSLKSPAVMNAIYALSSAHLEFRGICGREKSVFFHSQAIQSLARMIEQGCGVNRNELLAAIILLVYYEVLVQTGRSTIVDGHLKGAMAIMNNSQGADDPASVFLERAFRFYDVIASLSLGTAPISPALESGGLAPFPPVDCHGTKVPAGNPDALLGMATPLWPIMHRLSSLTGLRKEMRQAAARGELSKAAVLRTQFNTAASAVEHSLQTWQPVLPSEEISQACVEADGVFVSEEKTTASRKRLQSILNSAIAYRHSGFVYLYRTVYGYDRSHSVVQNHTRISLENCMGTVINEGPLGALLWPLFVAACEAVEPSDRDHAEQSFQALARRQGMMNIDRAWCIVQEVWRRSDDGDEESGDDEIMEEKKGDLWRKVSEAMGVTVVLG